MPKMQEETKHIKSLLCLDHNASKLNKNKLSAFSSRCRADSHGKVHGVKELLEQLRGDRYPGCGSWVQAKAALIAVRGTVVVARPVETLAQQPA